MKTTRKLTKIIEKSKLYITPKVVVVDNTGQRIQ